MLNADRIPSLRSMTGRVLVVTMIGGILLGIVLGFVAAVALGSASAGALESVVSVLLVLLVIDVLYGLRCWATLDSGCSD